MKNDSIGRVSTQSRSPLLVFAAALLALAVMMGSVPAVASAAAATATPGWAYIDISADYEQGISFCLVGGELATTTPLPQAVKVAVPASSTPQWVGEIFPSNSASDTPVPYSVTRSGTVDIYSLTLTNSRLAQVEALVPGLITVSGSNYVVKLSWVAPVPAANCRISVTMPPNAELVKLAEGAQTTLDTSGFKHYYRVVKDVKAGDKLSLEFTYTIPTATPPGATGSISPLWWILGIGVVVAIVLLVIVLQQRARSLAGSDGNEPEDAGADDEEDA